MPALTWLDEQVATTGRSCHDMVRAEHQRQVGTNVTVRNVITSMRLVSALDWAKIFESSSLVDAALRAEIFPRAIATDMRSKDWREDRGARNSTLCSVRLQLRSDRPLILHPFAPPP